MRRDGRDWAVPRFVGLIGLTAAFGVTAVLAAPDDGYAVGIWPVVGATVCLLLRRRPPTALVVVVIAVAAIGTVRLARPTDVAVGLGLALTVEAVVTWWVLTLGARIRPRLHDIGDLARLLVATLAGASCAGAIASVTSVMTGWGDPVLLAASIGSAGLASQIVLLPLFHDVRVLRREAGPVEAAVQWGLVLAVTLVGFVPEWGGAAVFLIIGALVWGGLRGGTVESGLQLILVCAAAVQLTSTGLGPFARAATAPDRPADLQGVLLAMFLLVCALVVLALGLTVGELREQTRQVAGERDRVQSIVAGTRGVAIIGTDTDGRITLFNPGAERLLGYSADEVLGRHTRMLHTDDAIAEAAATTGTDARHGAVARALAGRGAAEVRFLRKDGVERIHRMTLAPVVDDGGTTIGYVSTSEDVTELLESERRLTESLEAERRAVERLRDVDRVKDTFVSNVSHELRTPITSILGYTELLADGAYGELTEEQLDAIRRVEGNGTRLLGLIADLLTLSRVEEDQVAVARHPVDLREIARGAVSVVQPVLEGRVLEVVLDLPAGVVPVLGDPVLLDRVASNLVANAVKFTPDGGRVEVRVVVADGRSTLLVNDTGIGIPADEQDRLFERFFRSSTAQDLAIPGTGLGLAISRTIVQRHAGTISVQSTPGEGTSIRVDLPLAEISARR